MSMRRVLIALAFLALMSIPPILRTVADLNAVGTGPTDVNIVPLLTIVDPSTIPKSDPVTSMPAGVLSTYNIYPTTTSLNTYFTLTDTWYAAPTVAVLAPQAIGAYHFYDYIYLTNPSYKWTCGCFAPIVMPQPSGMVSALAYAQGIPSNAYLKGDLVSNITWSGQNLFVWRLEIIATVTSTSGVFNIILAFNQLRTDPVHNGVVDIYDAIYVANHYGTTFTPDQPRNYDYNIVMDFAVDYYDEYALQVEFGRTIPP